MTPSYPTFPLTPARRVMHPPSTKSLTDAFPSLLHASRMAVSKTP